MLKLTVENEGGVADARAMVVTIHNEQSNRNVEATLGIGEKMTITAPLYPHGTIKIHVEGEPT